MPLERRQDDESRRYWESVDRIAQEAQQQRDSIIRQSEQTDARRNDQRECTATRSNSR